MQRLDPQAHPELVTPVAQMQMLAGRPGEAPCGPVHDPAFPADRPDMREATITFWGHPITDNNAWCYAQPLTWVFTVTPC